MLKVVGFWITAERVVAGVAAETDAAAEEEAGAGVAELEFAALEPPVVKSTQAS